MDKVKVIISNEQKEVAVPTGIRLLIRRCCHAVLQEEDFHDNAEVSVSFVNNEQIHELNKKYRNVDRETDVLSFPKAMEQANLYNHSLQREIGFLTVHSMLHLLGYDHEKGGIEEVHMREKEETVLTKIGLKRDNSYYMGDE